MHMYMQSYWEEHTPSYMNTLERTYLPKQGEEINVGIRGFTHGYDFYAPRDSVVFHEYAEKSKRRKKIPMFW